jgi:hypothetical protein
MMKAFRNIMVAGVSIFLASGLAARGSISTNYGDYEATMVWYNQVSESTDAGAYGSPTVTGDSLTFTPLGVKAESSEGGTNSNTAIVNFDVQAKGGKYIAGFLLSEQGDFSMYGALGTDATYVDVTANFVVEIQEVDGLAIGPVSESFSLTLAPKADGTFEFLTDGGGSASVFNPYQGEWGGTVYIDLGDILDNNSIPYSPGGGATLASVNIENILTAGSEVGTSSFIQKKYSSEFTVTSDVVPEPASALLIAGSTAFLAFFRRRFIG